MLKFLLGDYVYRFRGYVIGNSEPKSLSWKRCTEQESMDQAILIFSQKQEYRSGFKTAIVHYGAGLPWWVLTALRFWLYLLKMYVTASNI
jgi:hypothetical protein